MGNTTPVDLTVTAHLIDEGRFEVANGLLRMALLQSLDAAESAEVFLQLARIHAARGQRDRAKRFVKRILLDDPQNAAALSALAGLEAKGNSRRGRQAYGVVVAVMLLLVVGYAMLG